MGKVASKKLSVFLVKGLNYALIRTFIEAADELLLQTCKETETVGLLLSTKKFLQSGWFLLMILDSIGCLGSSDEVLPFLQRLSKNCSLQKKRRWPTFTKILKYHLFSVWLTCGWYIINCSNSHYCHEIFLCNNKVSLQINNRQYSSNIKRLKWVGNISNRNIFLCHVFDTMCMYVHHKHCCYSFPAEQLIRTDC